MMIQLTPHTGNNVRAPFSSSFIYYLVTQKPKYLYIKNWQAKPLAARFTNPALDEVMRIIPFTLRITHYSRAPASWPGRPKIHVAGYAPLDTPAGITSESEDRQRRLRGTVEMTASGDVRWTIVRPRYMVLVILLHRHYHLTVYLCLYFYFF
jgi:hypothetical protein